MKSTYPPSPIYLKSEEGHITIAKAIGFKKYLSDDEMISHFCNILCNLIGKDEWREVKKA